MTSSKRGSHAIFRFLTRASDPRGPDGPGALASLVATVTAPAASASAKAAAAPRTAASAGASSRWHARTILHESAGERLGAQLVDPRAGAGYTLTARIATPNSPAGRYRLRRTDLATGKVRQGPVFPVAGLALAAGYLWVSGDATAGPSYSSLLVYQVNPATLAVIRLRHLRRKVLHGAIVTVTAGPGHTAWVGFLGRMLRIDTRTGALAGAITLPHGALDGGAAVDPAGRYLYVAARYGPAEGDAFEYAAGSGRLLASNRHHVLGGACGGCAALTAAPGGVWASVRVGTEGHTLLLRQRGLGSVPLPGGIDSIFLIVAISDPIRQPGDREHSSPLWRSPWLPLSLCSTRHGPAAASRSVATERAAAVRVTRRRIRPLIGRGAAILDEARDKGEVSEPSLGG